jgi:hypothetical protein
MVLLIIEGYEKAEHSVEKAPGFTVVVRVISDYLKKY